MQTLNVSCQIIMANWYLSVLSNWYSGYPLIKSSRQYYANDFLLKLYFLSSARICRPRVGLVGHEAVADPWFSDREGTMFLKLLTSTPSPKGRTNKKNKKFGSLTSKQESHHMEHNSRFVNYRYDLSGSQMWSMGRFSPAYGPFPMLTVDLAFPVILLDGCLGITRLVEAPRWV